MRRARFAIGLLAILLGTGLSAAGDEPVPRPDRIEVVDVDGKALDGALLSSLRAAHAGRALFDAQAPVHARAGADGVFDALPSLADVPGRLVVWAPGHAAVPVPASSFRARVVLPAAETIEGMVRFSRGVPAAQVVVYAVPLGAPDEALAHRAVTDASGSYRFAALPRGQYEVQLLRNDERLQPMGTFAAGDDVPDVLLVGVASVAGRLLDGDGTKNASAPGVTVRLEPMPGEAAGAAPREARTDEQGAFLIGDLVPGIYRAVITDPQWELDQERPYADVRAGSTQHMPAWFVRRRQALIGQVVDADGKPLARARVALMRHAPEDPEAEQRARGVRPTVTNGDGAFRMVRVSAGEGYRLIVTAADFAPFVGGAFDVGRGRPTTLAPVKLSPGWTLVLQVNDGKGRGIADVGVRGVPALHPSADVVAGWEAFVARGRTDGAGRLELRDLPDSDLQLAIAGKGWLPHAEPVSMPLASRVRELRVTLTPASRVTGKVFREDAVASAGYLVRAVPRDGSTPVEVRTDASGTFAFATLDPVATDVEVRPLTGRPELTLARIEAVLPSTDPHLEIALPAMRTLRGVASNLDPDDRSAVVLLEAPRYDPVLERHRYVTVLSQPLTVDIRGDAVFAVEDVPPGIYALRAVQGTRDSSALPLRVGEEDLEDLRLPIPPGARVGGTVVDDRSAPVLGAIVRLHRVRGDGDQPLRPGGPLSGSTDEGGAFVFDDVAPGVWRLEVEREQRATAVRELRVSEGEVLVVDDIVLDVGATIEGRAWAANSEPLDGARVTARRFTDPVSTHEARTDAEGGFRLPFVPPGVWIVTLEAETGSGRRPEALVEVGPGETVNVDFAVAGRAVIEGTVAMQGRRIAGALLELMHDPEDPDAPRRRFRTQTDGTGRFRWTELLQGRYRLYLEHGSARIEQPVYVDDVDRLVLDLEAQGARLAGQVVGTQGVPVPSALVVARPIDSDGRIIEDGLEARVRTGPRGGFALTGLAVGWYTLQVSAPGYPPGVLASAEAELVGADRPVTVVLGRGGALDLAVVDEARRPVSGARVWLEDASGASFHAQPYTTGPGGRILLEGVPPGEVRVRVQARGFGRSPLQGVSMSEGGRRALRVVMRRPGTLQIYVRGTGRDPTTRARVTLLREGTDEVVERRRSLGRIQLDPRWGHLPKTGLLVIDDLETGAYEIVVDAGGTYAVARVGVDVAAGAITVAEVHLLPR